MSVAMRRIWMQLTADKRRFRALMAVLGLGVVVWAKPMGLFIWARMRLITGIPRTAMAEDPLVAPPSAPIPVAAPPAISVSLDGAAQRDPFHVSEALYPKPIIPQDLTQDQGKSDPQQADDPAEAEARLTNRLRELAAQLRLEALMSGLPMAVINGTTVRIGDSLVVDGASETAFQLVEIRSRSVILECQGRLFEIEMFTPLPPSR